MGDNVRWLPLRDRLSSLGGSSPQSGGQARSKGPNRAGAVLRMALVGLTLFTGGCIVAAAGAGAGGAVYLSDRGAESVVDASVERTYQASRQAFRQLSITEEKTSAERDGGEETRELKGKTADRDVTVTVKSQGKGAHVSVVARKSAVTWDKDFARKILETIVADAKQ